MPERRELQQFEQVVMPHLAAAYNVARWLVRDERDAEDVLQEACLRALRAFGQYRGGDARAWLLTIVRNACYTWLRRQAAHGTAEAPADEVPADQEAEPEMRSIRHADGRLVQQALEELPVEFREAFVLREIEGLSYKEIADVADVPIGTVMSRLARARRSLQRMLARRLNGGPGHDV